MADGLSATHANSYLNVFNGVTYTGFPNIYVQLHTGSPGASGTSNISLNSTRNAITWNAPVNGSMTLLAVPTWTMVAIETLTDVSLWTAATLGTFLWSSALSVNVPVLNGSKVSVTQFTLGITPIAV